MNTKVRDMILVALFAALMAVGAMIKIYFPFVPLTFQPFFCAFAGILLGSKLGFMSQMVYIAIGLAGVPVFTHPPGPQYIFNPTFGYLLGFAAGAYVIGKITEQFDTLDFKKALLAVLTGLLVIYVIGVPYLYLIVNFYSQKPMTLAGALAGGFTPFIFKDIIMFVIVAIVACKILPILKKAGLTPTAQKR